MEASSISRHCCSRIGLLGNPSDGYGGKCVSIAISNFSATVTLVSSPVLRFIRHPVHDNEEYTSLAHLHHQLSRHGYGGGVRLLQAICKQFYEYCRSHSIDIPQARNFTLSYETDIPRQVGLSGSSAIACAALSCLMAHYDVAHLIPKRVRPNIILQAEHDLGITAGLQDRVIQVYGGAVFMDFSEAATDQATGAGTYTQLPTSQLPEHLYIVHCTDSASESGKVHSSVRQRWLAGDEEVRSCMTQVAECAEQGRRALEAGDAPKLAQLMNRNFDLRRRMFGDAALGQTNLRMIELARSVGCAAKFCGSGGAVVVLCPEGEHQAQALQQVSSAQGFSMCKLCVAPHMDD